MTKKRLNEIKAALKYLKEGRASAEQMSDETYLEVFGISKKQGLANIDAGIAKYEREIERAEHPLAELDKKLYDIAAKNLVGVAERGDLQTRHSDCEDFIDVAVWELEAALKEAYEAGRRSK